MDVCDKPGAVAVAAELGKLKLTSTGEEAQQASSSYGQADYKKRVDEIDIVRNKGRLGTALKMALDAYDVHIMYMSMTGDKGAPTGPVEVSAPQEWPDLEPPVTNTLPVVPPAGDHGPTPQPGP